MASLEAQRTLEFAILSYMYERGFHQIGDAFSHEINANQDHVAINSHYGEFLQSWWAKFHEAYSSRFPEDPVFAVESLDKVAQTVEDVVTNTVHMREDISNVMVSSPVMPSPRLMASSVVMESDSPDSTDARISYLLSSVGTGYELPDLSPTREMPSSLQFLGMNEFASNSGNQMQQTPVVPPEWSARDDRPIINFGGPMLMEPNIQSPANALPASSEPSDTGHRYLQQASHQVCPSVDVLPNVAVQRLDKLKLPALASSGDSFRMLTQADLRGKDSGMLCDTNKRTPENLPADQQIIAPIGGIMRSSGKQPSVQEQINQLQLQSSNMSGTKRKTPLSSLISAGKEKEIVAGIAKDNTKSYIFQVDSGLVSRSDSIFAAPARTQAEQNGISFKEIRNLRATKSKLLCCHFNSQGELLATAGHDRKVLIWELGNNNIHSGEGHAHYITDVRFRQNSTVFATSSFDRTVKIWDAAKPSNPFRDLVGHAEPVMSIDFHPIKVGLLSSCDSNGEIRLWDVNRGHCKLILKGGSRQVRFQPRLGNFLASSTGNIINIFDMETNSIQIKLQGHIKDVRSICWDMGGICLASVSEDSARIWSVSDGKCLHELWSSGNKFQSCTFHPGRAQMLVIGSDEFLELWNPIFQSNKTWPYSAHAGIVSSLADSPSKGTIASVSHDQWIKIWQ